MILGGVYIAAIGCVKASGQIDNIALSVSLGKDEAFLKNRIGTLSLPEAIASETATELGASAAQKALKNAGVSASEVGLLIFVSQNPDHGGLPHNAAILQDRLGLPKTTICFDLGLGCSGYTYGLMVAASLMKAAGCTTGLVITSDQYRDALAPVDVSTHLLFGDAACATILSLEEGPLELRAARVGTDGSGHTALIRGNDGIIMNGRAVFGFSRKVIPAEITAFLVEHHLAKDSIDALLLHQGSRAIVEEIRLKLEMSEDRVPVEIEGLGNTVSSSLPFLLAPRLGPTGPKRVIAAGFGVGLSWGFLWLERRGTVSPKPLIREIQE